MSAAVHKAAAADSPEIVETLCQAFFHDPFFRWWIPEEGPRKELLPTFFGPVVATYLAGADTYRVDDGVAAAVWSAPGGPPGESELGALVEQLVAGTGEYAGPLLEVLEELDSKHPTEPHFYLFFLATRPQFQSRGLGSDLMRAVLDGCDQAGTPAYLEATCEDNQRLYERHGFVATGAITVRDSPPLIPMWREPRSS